MSCRNRRVGDDDARFVNSKWGQILGVTLTLTYTFPEEEEVYGGFVCQNWDRLVKRQKPSSKGRDRFEIPPTGSRIS